MKTVNTPKGTVLPLTNLKGKDYLMVAYRLMWFNEDMETKNLRFKIETSFPLVNEEQTIATARVSIFDANGQIGREATATKRETKKDFPDHTEKAETSAVGRALAMLGYGTQFAVSDLEEGQRIVDSPVIDTKSISKKPEVVQKQQTDAPVVQMPKKTTFRKPADAQKVAAASAASDDSWE